MFTWPSLGDGCDPIGGQQEGHRAVADQAKQFPRVSRTVDAVAGQYGKREVQHQVGTLPDGGQTEILDELRRGDVRRTTPPARIAVPCGRQRSIHRVPSGRARRSRARGCPRENRDRPTPSTGSSPRHSDPGGPTADTRSDRPGSRKRGDSWPARWSGNDRLPVEMTRRLVHRWEQQRREHCHRARRPAARGPEPTEVKQPPGVVVPWSCPSRARRRARRTCTGRPGLTGRSRLPAESPRRFRVR